MASPLAVVYRERKTLFRSFELQKEGIKGIPRNFGGMHNLAVLFLYAPVEAAVPGDAPDGAFSTR